MQTAEDRSGLMLWHWDRYLIIDIADTGVSILDGTRRENRSWKFGIPCPETCSRQVAVPHRRNAESSSEFSRNIC